MKQQVLRLEISQRHGGLDVSRQPILCSEKSEATKPWLVVIVTPQQLASSLFILGILGQKRQLDASYWRRKFNYFIEV